MPLQKMKSAINLQKELNKISNEDYLSARKIMNFDRKY